MESTCRIQIKKLRVFTKYSLSSLILKFCIQFDWKVVLGIQATLLTNIKEDGVHF